MRLKNLTFLVIFLLFLGLSRNSIAIDKEEAIMFSGFIHAISDGIDGTNRGKICVLGYDEIVVAMNEKDKNLINVGTHPEKYMSCNMIYIAKDKEKLSRNFIKKYNKQRIVTVSLLNNFNEIGGMIHIQMGRRSFEISVNSEEIKKAGIKLAPLLLELVINN